MNLGHIMSRERLENYIIRLMKIVGILFFVLMVAFPFYWMIASSLRPLEEILMNPANLGLDFRKIDLSAYYNVLFDHGFVRYILNSLYVSIITVALSVA